MKLFFLIILVLLQSCISKPKVENMAMSAAMFSHTNFSNSCVSCHEVKRPATSTLKNLAGALVVSNTHYKPQDCATCHSPGAWLFKHNPAPASCNSCHEIKRPAPVALVPHGGGADCISCHDTNTWLGVTFTHDASINSCVSCHEVKRPTSSTHLNNVGVAVTTLNHYTTQDCAQCHTPGVWLFKHNPAPTSCTTCHEIKRPIAPHVGTGDCLSCHNTVNWTATFNHTPVPTSCVSCHETKRPGTSSHLNYLNVKVISNTHYSPQDCSTCHTSSAGNIVLPSAWAFKHIPLQTSCNSCHEVKRPPAPHVATGDCLSCHTTLNWIGTFNHSPTPASCISCHAAKRPTVNPGHNTKAKGHYNTISECKTCHTAPVTNSATTWKSGAKLNCIDCHLAKGQGKHGTSVLPGGSKANCVNCHNPTKSGW